MTALSAIHVAKKQLGLDEDTYRAVLVRITGKRSAGDMSERERMAVVEELRKRGFKPASKGKQQRLAGPFATKLQALWIAGWNLGIVQDASDTALLSFVKRQTGIDHTRFLRFADDAALAIEGLKSWIGREGGVDWSKDRFLAAWTQAPGYQIAQAQFRLLLELDPSIAETPSLGEWLDAQREPEMGLGLIDDAGWIVVMNELGAKIRAAKAAEGAQS